MNGSWTEWVTLPKSNRGQLASYGNLNNARLPGSYLLDNGHGEWALAGAPPEVYHYGQLVVTTTYYSVQQIYYSHQGDIVARQSYDGGTTWGTWKQTATMDLVNFRPYVVTESLSTTSNYRVWSSGLIEQWGYLAGGISQDATVSITFPIAFLTEVTYLGGKYVTSGPSGEVVGDVLARSNFTLTDCSFTQDTFRGNGTGLFWEARGK